MSISPHEPGGAPHKIDAYLDGLLAGDDVAAFEAEMARDAGLRAEVELHRRVEASLRTTFRPEEVALPSRAGDALPIGGGAPRPAIAPWRRSLRYQLLMLAAAAALLLATGLFVYSGLSDPGSLRTIGPEALYARVVDAGFKPAWVCNNDAEFAESVRYRLGQPLLVEPGVPGLNVLGWAYPHDYRGTPLSEQSMILLSTVDGEQVVVLADRASADRPLEIKSPRLNLFRRVIDGVVLYEVTPKDRPVVIKAMYRPEKMPEEPRPGQG